MKWYAITFRAPAEMTVHVLADTPEDARQRAEDGNYTDSTDIEFVRGRPYTTKVRLMPDPNLTPGVIDREGERRVSAEDMIALLETTAANGYDVRVRYRVDSGEWLTGPLTDAIRWRQHSTVDLADAWLNLEPGQPIPDGWAGKENDR